MTAISSRVSGTTAAISFIKDPGPRYSSHIRRSDGVVVELVAGGYNKVGGPAGRIPHDLAHFIVEDEFSLASGLWGTLAAGGLFHPSNTRVIAGRQRPHAARVGREIVREADESLKQAEILVRAVADLALEGRDRDLAGFAAATGKRWALSRITADQLENACRRLREGALRWRELPEQETIDVMWVSR